MWSFNPRFCYFIPVVVIPYIILYHLQSQFTTRIGLLSTQIQNLTIQARFQHNKTFNESSPLTFNSTQFISSSTPAPSSFPTLFESLEFERSTTVRPHRQRDLDVNIDVDSSTSTSCECFKYELYGRYLATQPKVKFESYCSIEASLFGRHQRVISYSLFQSKSTIELADLWGKWEAQHWERALTENLDRMRKYFPGWNMRVYSNLDENEFICAMRCNNLDFFWCDIRNIPIYGDLSTQMVSRTWRFLALGDPTVDIFLVRDMDSFLQARDAAAVQDWIENTTAAFHSFHDHPLHPDRVLGGLWGGRNNLLSNETAFNMHKMIVNQSALTGREYKNFDQTLADKLIHPMDKPNRVVSYDAYFCERWRNLTVVRPFPTRRKGKEFLGDIELWGYSGFGHQIEKEECPFSCRPEYGKDWSHC
ncbi:unnamed protein product [Orchesella dallaii]|uniref:Uncharacterized protein n=1 Tax=Orchesella dallaii TaxID=48710 RepID=A0ABP1RTP1_9HEXA